MKGVMKVSSEMNVLMKIPNNFKRDKDNTKNVSTDK